MLGHSLRRWANIRPALCQPIQYVPRHRCCSLPSHPGVGVWPPLCVPPRGEPPSGPVPPGLGWRSPGVPRSRTSVGPQVPAARPPAPHRQVPGYGSLSPSLMGSQGPEKNKHKILALVDFVGYSPDRNSAYVH